MREKGRQASTPTSGPGCSEATTAGRLYLVGFLRLLSAGEGRLEAGECHGLGNSWRQTAEGTGLEIRPRSQTALGGIPSLLFPG